MNKMMDDRATAEHVEFMVDATGKVWVNVNGVCILRIGHAAYVEINDHRDKEKRQRK